MSVLWSRGIRHQKQACDLVKIKSENGQKTSEKFGIFSFICRIVIIEKLMDLNKSTGFFHETLPMDVTGYADWIDAFWRRLTGLFCRYYAKLVPDRSQKKWTYLITDTTYENSGAYGQ